MGNIRCRRTYPHSNLNESALVGMLRIDQLQKLLVESARPYGHRICHTAREG